MDTAELLERAQEHFGIEDIGGEVQIGNHPERIFAVAPFFKGILKEKGKTRVIIDYDPDFPSYVIRIIGREN